MISAEEYKEGTEKTISDIKTKLIKVMPACSKKNCWTVVESFCRSFLTLTHSLIARFGIDIFASIRK